MKRIGIIGLGFMGYTHFEGARPVTGAEVTAFATRSVKKRSGDWTGIQGNFGPPGGHVDVSNLKACEDYREILNDPDIDLVDICLPTDQHAEVVIESLKAGKPTLVEKPIAVDRESAMRMLETSRECGVPLLVAHVLPFFPEFRFAAEVVQSKKFGTLQAAHFKRVICPPDWSDGMSDFRKLGGWGIDLHIHDNHFISHLLGPPKAVFSSGLLHDGFVNHVHSSYVYPDGPTVTSVSGGIAASGLAFNHGYELYLEKATIAFDAGTYNGEWVVNRPLSVMHDDGSVEIVDLSASDSWCAAFTDELQLAVDFLNGERDAGALSAETAINALDLCYAEVQSIQSSALVELQER